MAKRRANQEGTIFKKANGRWRAQVVLNGRRLSFTGDTHKECKNWLRETQRQIQNGLTFRGAEIRLGDFLTSWLATISSSRKPNTVRNYRWTVQKRILPSLGKMYLSDLKTEGIQRYYDKLISEGYSRHGVNCVHKTLRISLNHAVKLGHIGRNPCTGTMPPKPTQQEMKFLDESQAKLFLSTAQETGDRQYPLYYLAIHTGLRQAELLGLKWSDIDFQRRTLQVNRQVLHLKGESFMFADPKSASGRRALVLGNKALEVLQLQRVEVGRLSEQAGDAWTELDLVFPSNVGTPLTGSNLRRDFRKLLKQCKIPKIRFHDLRHTAASLMLNHGVPVLVASRRLGHSKASITMDVYGHLMPNKQEEAAELLDNLVGV